MLEQQVGVTYEPLTPLAKIRWEDRGCMAFLPQYNRRYECGEPPKAVWPYDIPLCEEHLVKYTIRQLTMRGPSA